MSNLRKNMRGDKRLNAFNNAFDVNHLEKEVAKATHRGEGLGAISVAKFSPYFNHIYKEYYSFAKKVITITQLTIDELEETMLAEVNRQFLLMEKLIERKLEEHAKINKGNVLIGNFEMMKMNGNILENEINIEDAATNNIDALNSAFPYFQYFERKVDDEEFKEPESINAFMQLSIFTNYFSTYKNLYDSLVWDENEVKGEENLILISLKDRNEAIIAKVGEFKIHQHVSAQNAMLLTKIKNVSAFRNMMEVVFREKRLPYSLAKVEVHDGYLIPCIKKGFSSDHLHHDIFLYTGVVVYYEFIEEEILPKTGTLKVRDALILFSEIKELIQATSNLKYSKKGYLTIDNLYKYPFKIKSSILVDYLLKKTKFKKNEIISFLEIITHKETDSNSEKISRINFWKKPFLERNGDLLFPILPITGANALFIVDEWLDAGGYSLDNRGYIFEKFIKESIQQRMDKKNFHCQIYKNQNLLFEDEKEEIDFLAEFKECIFIAEVKCIRYPIEARDRFNARKRLSEGASQLNRKIDFIEKHKDIFATQIPGLATKPIIRAVIANYPLLSTLVIDNVPITDINTIEYYITSGGLNIGVASIDKSGNADYSKTNRADFYKDEAEFCKNLRNHLVNPNYMIEMKKISVVERVEITDKNSSPRVFFEIIKIDQESLLKAMVS